MEILTSLQSTALSAWIRESASILAFPGILTLHTFGLGLLVGASAVFDLRLLGVGGRVPLAPMRTLFTIMWVGFALNAVTGTALFVADAERRGTSLLFLLKLALVAAGVATIVLIRREVYGGTRRQPEDADHAAVSATARILAVVSLVVWASAITAGRLLAYI